MRNLTLTALFVLTSFFVQGQSQENSEKFGFGQYSYTVKIAVIAGGGLASCDRDRGTDSITCNFYLNRNYKDDKISFQLEFDGYVAKTSITDLSTSEELYAFERNGHEKTSYDLTLTKGSTFIVKRKVYQGTLLKDHQFNLKVEIIN